MKAKSSTKTVFYCSECGNETAKWMGQCPACGAWNTLVEAPKEPQNVSRHARKTYRTAKTDLGTGRPRKNCDFPQGSGELDRVLGGGAVRGSLVLVGGAPGIGKSTLLLQLCGRISEHGERSFTSPARRAERQLKMRAAAPRR